MLGACVSRARLHAADGMPMPTKHTSVDLSARDAATVIISVGVNVSAMVVSSMPAEPGALLGKHFGALAEHIVLHPRQKPVAVARDGVPFLVIRVVALVV